MIEGALVLLVPSLLALANGANDVSKGIATLVGSGVASYRRAALWGAASTGIGAAVAFVGAGAMVTTFGNGLLAEGVSPTFPAAVSALAGAAAWVLVATRVSLPVSTTHALVGSVIGAAVAAYGVGGVEWPALGGRIVLPLLASPLAAFVLARLATKVLARGALPDCVCVSASPPLALGATGALAAAPGVAISIVSGHAAECERARSSFLRFTADHLHWLSSGALGFARGMNDAPKIVGLAAAAAVLRPAANAGAGTLFALVSLAMVLGSLAGGRPVTRVLAHDVTPMSHREGLAANLVTAVLVAAGAAYGLPMSTTHVSSGGIAGMGAARGSLSWPKAREIDAAWIVTVPASALLGAFAYALARGF